MIDLSGRSDVPVAEEVLAELSSLCGAMGIAFIVIGAAARDLVIHALQKSVPSRATEDIDIAVAVRLEENYTELTERLAPKGRSRHRFEILGIDVDIVPFGGIEQDRSIRFGDDHLLDVTGLREAHETSVRVRMPRGTELRVASAPAQTALKILAWRDRHLVNPKDGLDLKTILTALSQAPFDDEVWEDDEALEAARHDIVIAAAHHHARKAAAPFTPDDGAAVLEILDDARLRSLLERHMRGALASEMLDGYRRGFAAGLGR
jgi:predicted nucleotidyltransferase